MTPATARVAAELDGKASPQRWELYRLLAEPTRVRLLALASLEELAVSELAELLREGQPKVSRHAAALREAGLLFARKQGTWLLLRLSPDAGADPVVADAVATGLACCEADGTLERINDVVTARDLATREFFAHGRRSARIGPPDELAAYLSALAPLVAPRRLAIDAGTGDGSLLEVLAPIFEHVLALDRSAAQLTLARERASKRRFTNVRFVCGELDGPEVVEATKALSSGGEKNSRRRRRAPSGADAVFAARVLHHAPVPARAVKALTALARPATAAERGGLVVILDYESHRDDALREQQADLWTGFAPQQLTEMANGAGLTDVERVRLPKGWCGEGPDRHLAWQVVSGRRSQARGKYRTNGS